MNYISKHKQVFGLYADNYKKYRGEYTKKLYEIISSFVDKKTKDYLVLDLGCGVGNSTEPFYKKVSKMKNAPKVFGCDPDENMIKVAKKSAKKQKISIEYMIGSAEKIPFEKNTFNLIFSGAAFHWFANKKSIKEIKRVLKENGIYLIFWTQNTKNNAPVIGKDFFQKYKWKGIPQEWRESENVKKFLIEAGFDSVSTLKIPYVEKRSMNETIGLIKTNSAYSLLSEDQRKEFLREMKKDYKKYYGDNKNTIKQEIHICFGYKKN
jgi:ubiquinone/menaquinone biosynthesis C-methylase UbiE